MNSYPQLAAVISRVFSVSSPQVLLAVDGVNKTFRINHGGGSMFLRLSTQSAGSIEKLFAEAQVLHHLATAKVKIAAPITPGVGSVSDLFEFRGALYDGLATAVAPGSDFDETAEQLAAFGSSLASIHSAILPKDVALRSGVFDSRPYLAIRNARYLDGPFGTTISAVLATLGRGLNDFLARRQQVGLCHGDAWPGNAKFGPTGVTFYDFEHLAFGDQTFDIATVLWWLSSASRQSVSRLDLWRAFRSGYADQVSTQSAWAALPFLVLENELRNLLFMSRYILLAEDTMEIVLARSKRTIGVWTAALEGRYDVEQCLESITSNDLYQESRNA